MASMQRNLKRKRSPNTGSDAGSDADDEDHLAKHKQCDESGITYPRTSRTRKNRLHKRLQPSTWPSHYKKSLEDSETEPDDFMTLRALSRRVASSTQQRPSAPQHPRRRVPTSFVSGSQWHSTNQPKVENASLVALLPFRGAVQEDTLPESKGTSQPTLSKVTRRS
jgi:hypothetical protein